MSIALIKIGACPQKEMLDIQAGQAKRMLQSRFCELLTFLHSFSMPEQTVYDLTFLADRNFPRMILSIRCTEDAAHNQTAEEVAEHILKRLRQSYFSCEMLTGVQLSDTVCKVREALSGDVAVLLKSEKVMSSNVSYLGYYYYTDVLESNDGAANELDNYNDLFALLLDSECSLVSFQLIPAVFSQAETYALSSLSSELKSILQGIPINGQFYRENSAEEPQKTYAYYTERRAQPLYFCNILAASAHGHADSLAAILKTSIQASVSNPVSIDTFHIKLDKQIVRDYFSLPWNLANSLLFNYKNQDIWNGTNYQPTNLIRLPQLYTAEEASVFFRLPIDDGKIQGIRSNKVTNSNESIDPKVLDDSNIKFGALLNSPDSILGASASDFTRHGLIVGTPGSGKTTFAINLLLQFYRKGIPFLAIEPTKTEYRAMIDRIPDLRVFTPGNSRISAFSINPFVPPAGITVEQYIPSLMSAFRAAFDMESPLDVIFSSAIRTCYTKYGWRNDSKAGDSDVQPFGLYEFILTFKELVATSSYSKDVRSNIETGGTFRLMNLIQQNSTLYDTVNATPVHDLLSRPIVLELNAISDDEQKALLIALLLIQVSLYTMSNGSSAGRLKNVLLLDEAHVLLGDNTDRHANSKGKNSAVQLFQKMIAEIRSFGMSMIVADQAPSQVTRNIVANTDIKIAFRLVEKEEREIIANSTGMSDDYMNYLAQMQTGTAITYYSRLESPKIIVTPDFRENEGIRLNVNDYEIKKHTETQSMMSTNRPFYECRWCSQCRKGCSLDVRNLADYYSSRIIALLGQRISDEEVLTKYMFRLHNLIIQYEKDNRHNCPIKTLCNCSKIQFLRKVLLENRIGLNRQSIDKILRDTLIPEVEV